MNSNEAYELLLALPTWAEYSRAPSAASFAQLVAASIGATLRAQLPHALASLFATTSNWRVAQHLANELLEIRDGSLAQYYAGKATSLSGGHPLAKLSLARCFWLQRFPEALVNLLNDIVPQLENFEWEAQRAASRYEIVDLYVNAYCYGNRPDLARPWAEELLRFGRIRGETLVQLLTSAFDSPDDILAFGAAARLAQSFDLLSKRDRECVLAVTRSHFLRILRQHHDNT